MQLTRARALGTIGDFGCYSFHETKNYTMGEGGALLFQDSAYLEQAEILREKGTNRSKFFRGQIDKYTWVGYGSSYLPSDMNAAIYMDSLRRRTRSTISAMRSGTATTKIWRSWKEKAVLPGLSCRTMTFTTLICITSKWKTNL